MNKQRRLLRIPNEILEERLLTQLSPKDSVTMYSNYIRNTVNQKLLLTNEPLRDNPEIANAEPALAMGKNHPLLVTD